MEMKNVDHLMDQIRYCREQLKQDWMNFDNASPEYIDVAVLNIKATEKKYKALCDELKKQVFPREEKQDKIYKKLFTFIK